MWRLTSNTIVVELMTPTVSFTAVTI